MSKSKGNVVNPDDYYKKYGADTLRMYLMFLGPFSEGGDWQDKGVIGIRRFLGKVWGLKNKVQKEYKSITALIPDTTKAVPTGVVLNILQINPENKTIVLGGAADTRDNLLRLEENIKKIEWIQSTDLPLSQLIKKDKISFSLSATMK